MKKILCVTSVIVIIICVFNSVLAHKTIETASKVRLDMVIDSKKIALSFDDGPNEVYTKKLLDGLKERNVKATFFLMGTNIEGNEELVKQMKDDGHIIGNHTFSHVNLEKITFKQACEEIERTNETIYDITGCNPSYIRPPFGAWNDNLKKETAMSIVLWNVDPLDWKDQNANIVSSRILKTVKSGDIILLHDIFESSVDAAFIVIDTLLEEGYDFVTIDELGRNKRIYR